MKPTIMYFTNGHTTLPLDANLQNHLTLWWRTHVVLNVTILWDFGPNVTCATSSAAVSSWWSILSEGSKAPKVLAKCTCTSYRKWQYINQNSKLLAGQKSGPVATFDDNLRSGGLLVFTTQWTSVRTGLDLTTVWLGVKRCQLCLQDTSLVQS